MRILITGGAGFIGSNLAESFLQDKNVTLVRVLDNLATGSLKNIRQFSANPKFEFIEGDIRDYTICQHACEGIDVISHQAALGSVPRSIDDPLTSNNVNITGTLHMFLAAKEKKIRRLVYAASSSTYGDHPALPKVEDRIGKPLSPYAVTKYVNELYADVFSKLYGLELIGLRYFNIFGPKQNPKGPYAAVIPLFIKSILENTSPTINGDGTHSRDFTHVANAVLSNRLAMFTKNPEAINQVYNIAAGGQLSLLELFNKLREIAGSSIKPVFGPERKGDVKHSYADIGKAQKLLDYKPELSVHDGLRQTFDWYKSSEVSVDV
jgi:UDP-N-acetylglucosamine/UDP-N-acetylgalactosamine 4-epimerase